ncbi:MAG: DNA methyltransferase [Chloroflexota bacterium]|nr:DNA methyltransferase [Chloroflexota bacterium]
MKNTMYYGDNLEILRNPDYFPNECVDLIYLDPPFNSNRNYNVLFKAESGADSEAQITAFEDTWHWGETALATYFDLVRDAPAQVSTAIKALMDLIGHNQMMAYLVMMAARLIQLQRVLKRTGSLYLHCDPTASHYLKILLDSIFGTENYRNEIVWQRAPSKGLASRRLPTNHDVILAYQKTQQAIWKADEMFVPYDMDDLDEKTLDQYSHIDEDGRRYSLTSLVNPNQDRPNLTYEFLGISRVWRWTKERMQQAYEDGIVVQTKPGNVPRQKRYLDEQKGKPLGDIWTDIPPLQGDSAEKLSYPTQKPVALLERIIRAASNEGDIVLDPFCGCGTTIAAAQKLNRRWIGIDITHLSIALQKYRLQDKFELVSGSDYDVIGEPVTVDAARALAHDPDNEGRYQFEWWALSLIGAKPTNGQAGSRKGKKGADRGIDGVINFFEEDANGKPRAALVVAQVKSGRVTSRDIRDLKGTVERENAAIGVFITLEKPTQAMLKEALLAGYYESRGRQKRYRKIQILGIGDLLEGAGINMPSQYSDFKRAQRHKSDSVNSAGESQQGMF